VNRVIRWPDRHDGARDFDTLFRLLAMAAVIVLAMALLPRQLPTRA